MLLYTPLLKKKPSGNFLFKSVFNFSVTEILLVSVLTWLQNELIGWSQRSNKTIPSVPNKFVGFFITSTTDLLIFPMKEMLQANSPKNFHFFPDTLRVIFLEFNKQGLSSVFLVFSLIIVISDPESNCKIIFLIF